MMAYLRDPQAIEAESFRLIRAGIAGKSFAPLERAVVERVIHATADFSYAEDLRFSPGVVEHALGALKRGCALVTDTRMAKAGVNPRLCGALGLEVRCALEYEGVEVLARRKKVTRAMASMMLVAEQERDAIFLVGNAPTALFALVELFWEGKTQASLVIGVPVGLVGAEEAKKALRATSLPSITTVGPRGGTPVAVAILHALLKLAVGESHG